MIEVQGAAFKPSLRFIPGPLLVSSLTLCWSVSVVCAIICGFGLCHVISMVCGSGHSLPRWPFLNHSGIILESLLHPRSALCELLCPMLAL